MSINLKEYRTTTKTEQVSTKQAETTSSVWEFLNKDISLFGNGLNLKKKEAFYAELEVLLNAGLDLKTALDLTKESQVNEKDKALFQDILDAVVKGNSLSNAMEQTGKFSAYEVFSIQIAEESGKLAPILADLSTYFAKNIQYKRLLISALSYPVLVIGVALLALVFLLNFLVPLFGDMYSRLGHELPTLTQYVVQLSNIVSTYFSTTILVLLILSGILYTQRKTTLFRKVTAWIILHIPVIGNLVKQLYLARFTNAMSFLLMSKVPMLKAIDLIQKMVGFYPIESSLDQVSSDILKGKNLNESLRDFSFYPNRMIALIRVGEEANQLENMFAKLAHQYSDEVEQQTKMLGSLIEPILIIFLALVVGMVLVAMYLPIFQLVTNAGM